MELTAENKAALSSEKFKSGRAPPINAEKPRGLAAQRFHKQLHLKD
jgi:hypothetical protein